MSEKLATELAEWMLRHGTLNTAVGTPPRESCIAPASFPPAMNCFNCHGMPAAIAVSRSL